jgi:hypothetical protein
LTRVYEPRRRSISSYVVRPSPASHHGSSLIDEELFVRSAQCSALFPMIQFSAAPWRVLRDAVKIGYCRNAALLHRRFGLTGFADRVDALGGRLGVDSPVGRGTRISVELRLEVAAVV